MSDKYAFIGDVHGNLQAVESLVAWLAEFDLASTVLLGDYLNKGPNGAGVIDYLIQNESEAGLVPLIGNHESIFLDCMASGDIRPLLRMSGAPTVRSYVGKAVGPDVYAELRTAVPQAHIRFLSRLSTEFSTGTVRAAHVSATRDSRYQISGHVSVGLIPRIGDRAAHIDTGCGAADGRLTAFLWPSRRYLQVDHVGVRLDPAEAVPRGGSAEVAGS
ncbi:metallophosphoesterase [Cellulosimicrobium sp. 72-3]|uniref:metallophosphoesterase n=1 Tax=Cellulosimicrobium sp. 72-3 TaxID=2731680 RepID=UPI00148EB414